MATKIIGVTNRGGSLPPESLRFQELQPQHVNGSYTTKTYRSTLGMSHFT